jgi:hypothetical protein
MTETQIENELIDKLTQLKYIHRPDIHDRQSLEQNFRDKFEALNQAHLSDSEFARLLEQLVSADVFAASRHLRARNSFERDDGTPLFYTLVNIKEWCKNTFEVVSQLRINTHNSHHRYDVVLLINGVPTVQIELKALQINPHRAMQQVVNYKNDPGLKAFRGMYLTTAQRLKTQQSKGDQADDFVQQLDFEFVLFASAVIDYDYIKALMSKCTRGPAQQMMSRREAINSLIAADAKFMDEREDLTAYFNTLVSRHTYLCGLHLPSTRITALQSLPRQPGMGLRTAPCASGRWRRANRKSRCVATLVVSTTTVPSTASRSQRRP